MSSRQRATARERAVAEVVTPLVADAFALHRHLSECQAGGPAGGAAGRARAGAGPNLALFAEQMRASAELLAARVREIGGRPATRDSDAAAADAPAGPGDALRRLLAEEDEVAVRLRRAIAACDRRTDEQTASCLEEVLDEVELQRSVLRAAAPRAARAVAGAAPTAAAADAGAGAPAPARRAGARRR
jgi:hypothetical protein